jgi:hypothetical protein
MRVRKELEAIQGCAEDEGKVIVPGTNVFVHGDSVRDRQDQACPPDIDAPVLAGPLSDRMPGPILRTAC